MTGYMSTGLSDSDVDFGNMEPLQSTCITLPSVPLHSAMYASTCHTTFNGTSDISWMKPKQCLAGLSTFRNYFSRRRSCTRFACNCCCLRCSHAACPSTPRVSHVVAFPHDIPHHPLWTTCCSRTRLPVALSAQP